MKELNHLYERSHSYKLVDIPGISCCDVLVCSDITPLSFLSVHAILILLTSMPGNFLVEMSLLKCFGNVCSICDALELFVTCWVSWRACFGMLLYWTKYHNNWVWLWAVLQQHVIIICQGSCQCGLCKQWSCWGFWKCNMPMCSICLSEATVWDGVFTSQPVKSGHFFNV